MADIEILYEDADIIVCVKQVGMLSESGGKNSLPDTLEQQLSAEGREVTLYPVHRLDREAGGVMVYAKSSESCSVLSRQIQQGAFEKRYLAVVCGVPTQPEGELCDLLYHDKNKNKTYVVKKERRGVRRASLDYRVLATADGGEDKLSLLEIRLHTGRTHQIRVQFASRQLPLLGDGRYGGIRGTDMALWSYMLKFEHPGKGGMLTFKKIPQSENSPFELFGAVTENI